MAETPKPKGKRLGYAVELVEPLRVWCYMAGWGDGPYDFLPGARFWLDNVLDGQVNCFVGAKRPTTPGDAASLSGTFPVVDLRKVRRV